MASASEGGVDGDGWPPKRAPDRWSTRREG